MDYGRMGCGSSKNLWVRVSNLSNWVDGYTIYWDKEAQGRNSFSGKHEFSLGLSERETSVSQLSEVLIKMGLELKRETWTKVTDWELSAYRWQWKSSKMDEIIYHVSGTYGRCWGNRFTLFQWLEVQQMQPGMIRAWILVQVPWKLPWKSLLLIIVSILFSFLHSEDLTPNST